MSRVLGAMTSAVVAAAGLAVAAPGAAQAAPPPAAVSWSAFHPNPACPNAGRAAEQAAGRFYDVEASDTHAAAIGCIAYYGVTVGAGAGDIYAQRRVVTRQQMAVFLSRVLIRLDLQPENRQIEHVRFDDISGLNSQTVHAIQIVAADEIMPGLSPGRFAPGAPVRRDNMAMFLANLLAYVTPIDTRSEITVTDEPGGYALARSDGRAISVPSDVFTDLGAAAGGKQRHAINAMRAIGIVTGKSERRYDPSGAVTRAQMASFIVRMLGHTPGARPDGQVTLQPLPPAADQPEDDAPPPPPDDTPPPPPAPVPVSGDDPLGIIAHASFSRAYARPADKQDRLAVWLCNTPQGDQRFSDNRDHRHNPHNYADKFTSQVRTYFNWLSEGLYRPAFIPSGVVTITSRSGDFWDRCAAEVMKKKHPANTDGAIVVVDLGGSEQIVGQGTCGYYSQRAFPDNRRVVLVDSQAFLDPHVLAHEIGHSLCWPHSYSRESYNRDGTYWQYDDPMDIMGTPADGNQAHKPVPQVGTSVLNRYAAGWIKAAEVWVHEHGTEGRYKLHPIGAAGRKMLIVPFGPAKPGGGHDDYMVMGVRLKGTSGWWHADRAIPKEGVEIYSVGQSREYCALPDRGSCHGLARFHWPAIAVGLPYSEAAPDHVMAVAGEGWNFAEEGFSITVSGRSGDAFYVDVNHYSADNDPPSPLSTNFGAWERSESGAGYWLSASTMSWNRSAGEIFVGCYDGDPSVFIDSREYISGDYSDDLLRISFKADGSPDTKIAWWREIDVDHGYRVMPRYTRSSERFAVYLRASPGRFQFWWKNGSSTQWNRLDWDDTTGISAVMSALPCLDDI